MDIIIIGLSPWYFEIGSNCKSIALELSKHHRVLYINMPLDRRTIARESANPNIRKHLDIIRQKQDGLFQVGPNIWNYYPHHILESANWLPSTGLFRMFCRINGKRFAADIRRAAAMLDFHDYVLFNDNDIFRSFYLKDFLNPGTYVYYSRDYLVAMDYWKKHGKKMEPLHIAKADIAVANSIYLEKYVGKYNPNSHYIGQGCNITLFDPEAVHPIPKDFPTVKGPVVGYIGAILNMRLDIRILLEIANKTPDWNIVLVGPEDDFFRSSALHDMPNVFFLGRKDMKELPAYLARFDVCINPQLINEITIGNYPLKVDEYLAMGKPVVATRTEAMQIFEDCVYLAEKPEDYPRLIGLALAENDPSLARKRTALARSHTWEASVAQLYSHIEQHLKKKPLR